VERDSRAAQQDREYNMGFSVERDNEQNINRHVQGTKIKERRVGGCGIKDVKEAFPCGCRSG
jgi:hypothetical protein